MVIVRESPSKSKITNPVHWPPRSPHEALLSSPNGRKRLQDQLRRNSVSPSPVKRRKYDDTLTTGLGAEDEDEEDEETLQLQLKAIEARLKLKKLQKAKEAARALSENVGSGFASTSPRRTDERPRTPEPLERRSSFSIQVAHSPKAHAEPALPPESPRRVLLGIDKGVKAADISLKRARPPNTASKSSTSATKPQTKPKTFSERLADARSDDLKRQQKQDRQARTRSSGFGVKPAEEQNDKSSTKAKGAASVISDTETQEAYSKLSLSRRMIDASTLDRALTSKDVFTIPRLLHDIHAPDYDIPDGDPETGDFVVMGIIASKSDPKDRAATHLTTSSADPDDNSNASKFCVLHLTDLEWELDLFLFDSAFTRFRKLTVGTLIAILNPLIMPPKPHLRDTGKFSLKLGSSEDTVLEIGMSRDLNFCKSIKKDGKECHQWIDSRKTEFCDYHVNLAVAKSKSTRAELNTIVGPSLFGGGIGGRKRGETSRGSRGRGRGTRGGGSWRGGQRSKDDGLQDEGQYYDWSAHSTAYVVPRGQGLASTSSSSIFSAAKMLDAEDFAHTHGSTSRTERHKKRLAEQERERDIAKKLASMGGYGKTAGAEYMKHIKPPDKGVGPSLQESPMLDSDSGSQPPQAMDAASLGLVRTDHAAISLDPVKGKKSATAASTAAQPVGWGGAIKRGLVDEMRDKEKEEKRRVAERRGEGSIKQAMLAAAAASRGGGGEGSGERESSDDDLDIV